jgi:hypothetical protein
LLAQSKDLIAQIAARTEKRAEKSDKSNAKWDHGLGFMSW